MSGEFYKDMQAIGTELLTEFDQGGVFYISTSPGGGPKDNPGPPQEAQPVKLNAVVRGVAFKYIDRVNIVTTDLQTTFAVLPNVTPTMAGFIIAGGHRHKIVAVMPKPATGTPAAYTVVFRK